MEIREQMCANTSQSNKQDDSSRRLIEFKVRVRETRVGKKRKAIVNNLIIIGNT